MKELSVEEKAKRYDEAIERAKEQAIDGYLDAVAVNDIFPELAESEDERMKEAIIATIHLYYGEPLEDEAKEMIVWLEKQGEQRFEEVDNLHNYLYGEQKSSWSEEDEINLEKAIWYVGNPAPMVVKDSMLVEWLKSLKGRVQPKQEWNEEDENMLKFILTDYRTRGAKEDSDIITWLKSLRPQKQDVMSVDEFRHIVGYLVQDIVANEHMAEAEKQPTKFFVEKYYNKLSPQSHWKPSESDIFLLEEIANGKSNPQDFQASLGGLIGQLKKLREE